MPSSLLSSKRGVDFEVNLTKMKWCPKTLAEIPKTISRSLERDITWDMIVPVIGTDHVKEWILREDKDIREFFDAPNMMQEWIAEKLIKIKIPAGILPKGYQPKKVKALARGNKIAKFFGEDAVSTRNVECTLKLFDCKHCCLKQTLPGSGASPHYTIFEGTWESTEKGLKLDLLLRYSFQENRKPQASEFAIESTRSDMQCTLAWDGETERQLNGNLPAIVGTDPLYWANLVREGAWTGSDALRWNEEVCEHAPQDRQDGEASSCQESRPVAAEPDRSPAPTLRERTGSAPPEARSCSAAPGSAKEPPPAAKPVHKVKRPDPPKEPDMVSPVPCYIGFGIFGALVLRLSLGVWSW